MTSVCYAKGMTTEHIVQWIYENQPVQKKILARYIGDKDPKARSFLMKLTYQAPIYENDDGSIGVDPGLFKNLNYLTEH